MTDPQNPFLAFLSGQGASNTAGAVPYVAGQGQSVAQQGVTVWGATQSDRVLDARPVPGMGGFQSASPAPWFKNADGSFNMAQNNNPNAPTDPSYATDGVQPPTPPATFGSGLSNPIMEQGQQTSTNLGQAMQQLLQIGDSQSGDSSAIQQLQDQLVHAGYLKVTKGMLSENQFIPGAVRSGDATYNAYYNLLEDAIRTGTDYSAILDQKSQKNVGAKAWTTYQQVLGNVPQTYSRVQTDLSNPTTAQGLLQQWMTQHLGRNPTSDEIANFTSALTTAEKANPTVTDGVHSLDTPLLDKTTTTHGGIDPGQFTQNYGQQNFGGEANAVGDATSLYQAAMDVIGRGPVGGA